MDGPTNDDAIWMDAGASDVLDVGNRHVAKIGGKQILIFRDQDQLWACNNRCPHEGYPLSEGTITDGCVLTCNWHNWKFDLESGDTIVGGDKLRRYPVKVQDGRLWVNVSQPPSGEVIATALEDLVDCFDDNEYDRMAREVARIERAGGSALLGLQHALTVTHERFEYGMTHALAAGADWLRLYEENSDDPARQLASVVEVISHLAWDTRRMPVFEYTRDRQSFDKIEFLKAVEDENENRAMSFVRGAIADGLTFDDLYEPLCIAALAHYQDFGHSLIYVNKAREFIARAGKTSLEPVLLLLVRSLVYATREDLIPEFKAYRSQLNGPTAPQEPVTPEQLRTTGVPQCLELISRSDTSPFETYHVLLEAAAWQLLHLDLSYAESLSGPVQDNIGWLDVTHTITFANAVRTICTEFPDMWQAGLLQIGCFLGRNGKYMDATLSDDQWAVPDPLAFSEEARQNALHHGQAEYIVAAHIIKMATAVSDEITAFPDAPWAHMLAAGLNRFLHTPLRRRNPIRSASQALDMVKREA